MAKLNKYFKASLSHWEAQRDESVATLDLYLNKSVGIGEHSNLLDEINKWVAKLAEADENIASLNKYFSPNGMHKNASVEETSLLRG